MYKVMQEFYHQQYGPPVWTLTFFKLKGSGLWPPLWKVVYNGIIVAGLGPYQGTIGSTLDTGVYIPLHGYMAVSIDWESL